MKVSCPFFIRASYVRQMEHFVVSDSNFNHSHEVSKEIYSTIYPNNRITQELKQSDIGLLKELDARPKKIKYYLENKFSTFVTSKDVQNLIASKRSLKMPSLYFIHFCNICHFFIYTLRKTKSIKNSSLEFLTKTGIFDSANDNPTKFNSNPIRDSKIHDSIVNSDQLADSQNGDSIFSDSVVDLDQFTGSIDISGKFLNSIESISGHPIVNNSIDIISSKSNNHIVEPIQSSNC